MAILVDEIAKVPLEEVTGSLSTIAAVKDVGLNVPLVVRLESTNVELGKQIVNESGLDVIAADNLADAARKIVAAVKG